MRVKDEDRDREDKNEVFLCVQSYFLSLCYRSETGKENMVILLRCHVHFFFAMTPRAFPLAKSS